MDCEWWQPPNSPPTPDTTNRQPLLIQETSSPFLGAARPQTAQLLQPRLGAPLNPHPPPQNMDWGLGPNSHLARGHPLHRGRAPLLLPRTAPQGLRQWGCRPHSAPPLNPNAVLRVLDAALDARLAEGDDDGMRDTYLSLFCPQDGEWNNNLPYLYTHTPAASTTTSTHAHSCACVASPTPSEPAPLSPTTATPSADNAWATRKRLSTLSFTASTAEPSAKTNTTPPSSRRYRPPRTATTLPPSPSLTSAPFSHKQPSTSWPLSFTLVLITGKHTLLLSPHEPSPIGSCDMCPSPQ